MICPQCNYAMGAFDTECPRCHGKGVPQRAPQTAMPPVSVPATPTAPAHYSRFCPHCGAGMSSAMTICPSCRKSKSAPAVVPSSPNKLVGVGVAALFVVAAGSGFLVIKQGDTVESSTVSSETPSGTNNSATSNTNSAQPNSQNPAPPVAPTATAKPTAPQLQTAKGSSFEDTAQEDKCHAFFLDVKRDLTPIVKNVIFQYKLGNRSECRAAASEAYQITSQLREKYHSLSAPSYMRSAWGGFGGTLGSTADNFKDLLGELDGTGYREVGNSVESLRYFESYMEKAGDEITLARMKRPQ